MDVFNNPYWSLEQLHAWALTRDRDLVSIMAPTDEQNEDSTYKFE
jgi:hypothetical protein